MDRIADRATVAYSDAGTPLDVSDDLLYLADPAQNVVLRYSLGPSSAVLTARWDGFDGPIRLATGRWNGVSNRLLCVVDALAKRVRVFQDDDGMLVPLGEHRADHRRYDSAMTTDHSGQVYLDDEVGAGVEEYTPVLEFPGAQGGDGEKPAGLHEVSFDGRSPATGVSLYRIGAGSFTRVRRMVLVK